MSQWQQGAAGIRSARRREGSTEGHKVLTVYENKLGALKPQTGQPKITEQAIWIDLLNPTQEEEAKVEKALKIDVPTREEQQEIEASSRLYQEDGAQFMTATLLFQPEQGEPRTTPVTFILAGQRLVTVRYAEPRAFAIYVARCRPRRARDQERAIGPDRADRDHRRPARRFHRAHPGRGRGVVAFDLRDQGRRRDPAAPLRHFVAGDRTRRRNLLEGPRECALARPAAHLSGACRQ